MGYESKSGIKEKKEGLRTQEEQGKLPCKGPRVRRGSYPITDRAHTKKRKPSASRIELSTKARSIGRGQEGLIWGEVKNYRRETSARCKIYTS